MTGSGSTELAAANTGAGKVRVASDAASLAGWVASHVEGFARLPTAERAASF